MDWGGGSHGFMIVGAILKRLKTNIFRLKNYRFAAVLQKLKLTKFTTKNSLE